MSSVVSAAGDIASSIGDGFSSAANYLFGDPTTQAASSAANDYLNGGVSTSTDPTTGGVTTYGGPSAPSAPPPSDPTTWLGDAASAVGNGAKSVWNAVGGMTPGQTQLALGALRAAGGLLTPNPTAMQINAQNTWTQQAIDRARANQNVDKIQLPTVNATTPRTGLIGSNMGG